MDRRHGSASFNKEARKSRSATKRSEQGRSRTNLLRTRRVLGSRSVSRSALTFGRLEGGGTEGGSLVAERLLGHCDPAASATTRASTAFLENSMVCRQGGQTRYRGCLAAGLGGKSSNVD
jgi:hypothetical protein